MTCARFAAAARIICGSPREAILRAILLVPIVATVALVAETVSGQEGRTATKNQIDSAVKKAVDFLSKNGRKASGKGGASLAAYALVKAGYPPDDTEILATIDEVKAKIVGGKYTPSVYHFYEAGVDILALEAVAHESGDQKRYNTEIQAIVNFILQGQSEAGSWYYTMLPDTGGDTSITQYAMLGLWAASRSGIKIPPAAWQRCAHWHLKSQRSHGGFVYHPGEGNSNASVHSMTVNGVASLCIARMHLYPKAVYTLPTVDEFPKLISKEKSPAPKKANLRPGNVKKNDADQKEPAAKAEGAGESANGKDKKPKRKFGILELVNPETGQRQNASVVKSAASAKATAPGVNVSLSDLNLGIARGVQWLNVSFTIEQPEGWLMYYLYGMERMSALAGIEQYDGHHWYQEGAAFLVRVQRPDGGFEGRHSVVEGTSFALLFLTNATARLIAANGEIKKLGGGLLIGNRGLPEDLSQVNSGADGVKQRKMTGPIDELLAQLENTKSLNVEAAQQAIVEQVQLGDREALVGQRDRILKLVEDPRVEVRRTATWALSRCGTLDDTPVFIRILKLDPDLSVAIEANNALCWLSKRPGGVVASIDPFEGLDEGADDKTKEAAARKWRSELIQNWTEWFAAVQSYRDREFIPPPRPQ